MMRTTFDSFVQHNILDSVVVYDDLSPIASLQELPILFYTIQSDLVFLECNLDHFS